MEEKELNTIEVLDITPKLRDVIIVVWYPPSGDVLRV